MLGTDIAIDLGTYAIKLFVNGQGVTVHEPSVVTIDTEKNQVTAVGKKAYEMLGRTGNRLRVERPLQNGVISNFDLAQYLVSHYIHELGAKKMVMPRVVVSVPCNITEVEKRAVVDSISAAGVRKICLIQEPIAAAMGAGIDISSPHGVLVVDIGCGTTDMAVLSLRGVSNSKIVKIAGQKFDEAITRFIRNKYHLQIGERMAEACKIAIGGVLPRTDFVTTFTAKGKDTENGLPAWTEVTSEEVLEAMTEPAMDIVHAVQKLMEETDPELLGDVFSDGIILTGGSAKIYGFADLLSKHVGMPVKVAENPELCVALGAGQAIPFIEDLEKKREGIINPLSAAY